MRSRRWIPSGLGLVVLTAGLGTVAAQQDGDAQVPPRPEVTSDLVVTFQHVGGKQETFKDEIVRMELILDSGGRLTQVHLITRTGSDADTHIWYNVDNLVSVRYQFLAITGKAKVSVRTIAPPRLKQAPESSGNVVAPLEREDYR